MWSLVNYAVLRILLALAMCDNGSDSGATCSSGSGSEQELDSRSSQPELVEASVQAPKRRRRACGANLLAKKIARK